MCASKRKKTPSPSPPAKPRRNRSAARQTVLIRMYNVGFGDCFLVTVPGKPRPTRILFDCGSVASPPGLPIENVLKQLWADATDPGGTNPRIDVVVCTHRHRDHVSGFAKPGWEKVQVREVWMPWTEHPTDPEAIRIRETQSRLALMLEASLTARLAAPGLGAAERPRIEQWLELARNALSNERAMATLHDGFAGHPKRRFYPEKDREELAVEAGALPGVTAYVLGPSRDKEVIRDMDPPLGKSYLRLQASKGTESTAPKPFAPNWAIESAMWAKAANAPPTSNTFSDIVSKILGMSVSRMIGLPILSAEDQKAITELGDLEQGVAVSLDKAVNGTSLMIVLKIGQAHLLFPGDAQWGTWQAALHHPTAKELLRKTRFYKVGHHGSHNATPKEFVEETIHGQSVWSMVSTRTVTQWPEIPRQELLDAFKAHGCKFVRSDKSASADQKIFKRNGDLYVDVAIPMRE